MKRLGEGQVAGGRWRTVAAATQKYKHIQTNRKKGPKEMKISQGKVSFTEKQGHIGFYAALMPGKIKKRNAVRVGFCCGNTARSS